MKLPQWFKDYFYFEKRELIIFLSVIVFITLMVIVAGYFPTRKEREQEKIKQQIEWLRLTRYSNTDSLH